MQTLLRCGHSSCFITFKYEDLTASDSGVPPLLLSGQCNAAKAIGFRRSAKVQWKLQESLLRFRNGPVAQ